jgi:hypothetical protein
LKTLPRFSLNQSCKLTLGTVLLGLCLHSFSQTTPLEAPKNIDYPGIIQTFEKLIQIDSEKMNKRTEILIKGNKIFSDTKSVSGMDLEPDFLNSIILHSDPGYLRMASTSRCRFYESILTDLLRSSEGKIKNILVTYLDKEKRHSSIISKKDFLNKVINLDCPETQKFIAAFQVKTLQKTLEGINFDIPTGIDQCRNTHLAWLNAPHTPYLCQIHEYIKEVKSGGGDPKELESRKAIAGIIENKLTMVQRDYLENLCQHLDEEERFCEEFLNVSYWTKVAGGYEGQFSVEDICRKALGTENLSQPQIVACMNRLKKEQDLCHYPRGVSGLRPQPDCDHLSTALNFSSYKPSFNDCPATSDQLIATNVARIISHFTPSQVVKTESGPCSATTGATIFGFNQKYDNDENWKLEACYFDKLLERDVCFKTYFGAVKNDPAAFTSVVAEILKRTRGADPSLTCEMVDSQQYSPVLLQYRSGCFIIFEAQNCRLSSCKHKISLNDRPIDFIKVKGDSSLPYFPMSVNEERFSQNYILTRDFKRNATAISNLASMTNYFKKSRGGIVHGIGCAEDLLPGFFKTKALNQCSPLPLIVSGMIREKEKIVFVVRTSVDSLSAPRLLSWSTLYSAIKSYQKTQPLKQWTLYGLD